MTEEKCTKCGEPATHRVVANFRGGPKDGAYVVQVCTKCYVQLDRKMRDLGIHGKVAGDA